MTEISADKGHPRDFPGGPVAKTPQSRGPGFNHWSGNYIPHAATKNLHAAAKELRVLMLQVKTLYTATNIPIATRLDAAKQINYLNNKIFLKISKGNPRELSCAFCLVRTQRRKQPSMNQESGPQQTPNLQGKNQSSLEQTKSSEEDSSSLAERIAFLLG